MGKKLAALFALLLAATLLLSACGQGGGTSANNSGNSQSPGQTEDVPAAPQPFTVTAQLPQPLDTLEPAMSTTRGGETVFFHLYENLMKWVDDGSGFATLAPGQAASYTVETDYAGNACYTFTLREDIFWSDGTPVTAQDFVAAWQHLADPAAASPHGALLNVVAGYDEVQTSGDVSLLGVSAPDEKTFTVQLVGSCAWFLEEICACAYTVPTRKDAWNGPYTLVEHSDQAVTLQRSKTYYDVLLIKPEVLKFVSGEDVQADLAFSDGLPPVDDQADAALWQNNPSTRSYGVLINTAHPPFDDLSVRTAFQLAIDPAAIAAALDGVCCTPASGLVPDGISDYGPHPVAAEKPEDVLPDPNAEPVEEEPSVFWDFRQHSLQLLTQPTSSDYAANCERARAMLAQAGYAGGGGFPVVEYVYVESEANRATATALQKMWQDQLNVTVTARGLSQQEYDALLTPQTKAEADQSVQKTPEETSVLPAYQLVGMEFTCPYSDAEPFLSLWHSRSEKNLAGYRSKAFDILLDSAQAATSAEARDAYLHDAEAILITDAPVIPLYFHCTNYRLSRSLTGLYTAPDGVFFLSGIKQVHDN